VVDNRGGLGDYLDDDQIQPSTSSPSTCFNINILLVFEARLLLDLMYKILTSCDAKFTSDFLKLSSSFFQIFGWERTAANSCCVCLHDTEDVRNFGGVQSKPSEDTS